MASPPDSVALYWDFENLHAGLVDQAHGPGTYQFNRFRPQDEVIDVSALVEYALSIGPIAINRAFANWVSFNRYRQALLQNAVELIQVFPPGANAKNGADIKLCLDVMDDMARFSHIGTIIVVGGDSDYMPLSYKVKAAGRTLVGIGSRRSTNQHWARSCHEFKFYEALLAPPPVLGAVPQEAASANASEPAVAADATGLSLANGGAGAVDAGAQTGMAAAAPVARGQAAGPEAAAPASLGAHDKALLRGPAAGPVAGQPVDPPTGHSASHSSTEEMRRLLDLAVENQQRQRSARELVAKAILRLGQMRGERWIQKARLRPYIQRMDPTFHEANYGYASFNEMLATMDDLIDTRRGEFDKELCLVERVEAAASWGAAPASELAGRPEEASLSNAPLAPPDTTLP